MCTRLDIFDFTDLKLINFNSPIKNKKNIYISPIESPIELEIDESKVLKIFLNNKNNWELWYELDMDKESNKLIDLLNILDNIALNHSIKKSKEWFNKELTLERLQKLFIPSYNLEKINNEEVLYMRLTINDSNLVDKIRQNNNCKFIISIDGLYFFKTNFEYSINIQNAIFIKDDAQSINFTDILNKNTENTFFDNSKKNEVIEFLNNEDENLEKSITKNNKILESDSVKSNNTKLTVKELESLIDEKRDYTKKCFLQAEKVSRAAENLRLKAIQSVNTLREYEETYNNLEY
jgi:hypothetical protein